MKDFVDALEKARTLTAALPSAYTLPASALCVPTLSKAMERKCYMTFLLHPASLSLMCSYIIKSNGEEMLHVLAFGGLYSWVHILTHS
jgi:hypothetical protein